MPNLFNERLHNIRRIVLSHGISAIGERDLLQMITRPAVRRYDDEPETVCQYRDEVQIGSIRKSFGACDAEPSHDELDDELECYP